jgi:hypothetical protein
MILGFTALLSFPDKCQAFFAHGRQEFYDCFIYWITAFLEIWIIYDDWEQKSFFEASHVFWYLMMIESI